MRFGLLILKLRLKEPDSGCGKTDRQKKDPPERVFGNTDLL